MKTQNGYRNWTDKNGDEHGEWLCEFHPFFKVHVVLFKNGGGGGSGCPECTRMTL